MAKNYVHKTAIVEGDVVLGENVSVWAYAVLRGDEGTVSVGKNSNIQEHCVLHGSGVKIGENVTVGHGAIIHGATIASNVLVGMHATILDRVRVGPWTIVAAGSVVPPDTRIEGHCVVAGNPARRLRELTEKDKELIVSSYKAYLRHMQRVLSQGSK